LREEPKFGGGENPPCTQDFQNKKKFSLNLNMDESENLPKRIERIFSRWKKLRRGNVWRGKF
jgi:hypothetical protein